MSERDVGSGSAPSIKPARTARNGNPHRDDGPAGVSPPRDAERERDICPAFARLAVARIENHLERGEVGVPALVSCALFQFMWSCNDFMGPLLYVSTPGKYPMSLFVKLSMDGDTGFAWNKILALSLISILPQLIVFFCAQDQFVEGISAGAVKG